MKTFAVVFFFQFLIYFALPGQNLEIKFSGLYQFGTETIPFNQISFQDFPNYFSITGIKNENNHFQEAGLSGWGMRNYDVQNFKLKERVVGGHYGIGFNLFEILDEKIAFQLVGSGRLNYGYRKTTSKFFDKVIDKNHAFGLTLQTTPRIKYKLNQRWNLYAESAFSVFDFQIIKTNMLLGDNVYAEQSNSGVHFFPSNFLTGLGISCNFISKK